MEEAERQLRIGDCVRYRQPPTERCRQATGIVTNIKRVSVVVRMTCPDIGDVSAHYFPAELVCIVPHQEAE